MQDANQLLKQAQQAELQGNIHAALSAYQQVLSQHPNELSLHAVCGNLCVQLQRFEEAAGYFRRILSADNKNLGARNALCFALQALGNQAHSAGDFILAAASFEEALQHQASNAIYWYNLGNAQRELNKPKDALFSFTQSLKFDPNDADAHNNLGNVQRELGALNKAIASYETALQLNPSLHHALAHLVHQKQHICDWADLDAQISQLRNLVKTEPSAQISPFAFIAMPGTTAQEQKQCATNWANNFYNHLIADASKNSMPATARVVPAEYTSSSWLFMRESLVDIGSQSIEDMPKKIKIGYFSADFRLHPLAFLITELIEKHDRNRFEIVAYSYGKDDKTPARKRLEQAFDKFVNISNLNDLDAAKKIQQDSIDILVDLTGYTQSSRTGIVALKPATIHINWLGFPGTMGEVAREHGAEPLFDYLLADKVIAPNVKDFSEKLLYLPCYQPNDRARPVGKITSKAAQNLPEGAFVYCCFNQTFKITAEIFAVWMRILKQTPNSVLWLLECNVWAKANLQAAASQAGVDKNRLIFAPRVPIEVHLERHNYADLFLDTLPYNAHTTASDALFMRLPLLTCTGDTFASRVAASLLQRANLPELITHNLAEYEAKALDLAQNPEKLAKHKQKIHLDDLFNSQQFAAYLENIFLDIVNKQKTM